MAMLRSAATRSVLRSLGSPAARTTAAPLRQQLRSRLCTVARPSPWAAAATAATAQQPGARASWAQVRYLSAERKPVDQIDFKAEQEIAKKKIEPNPALVSQVSSTHPVTSEVDGAALGQPQEPPQDMMAGVKADLDTVRETFSLQGVPRQAFYVGLAGVLPYLATSLTTFFCASEINHAAAGGTGTLLSGKTAELALQAIEPLQVGYGAVIISFLGAIHWGLEFAGYGGHFGFRRYGIGVVATALAWPTILLPVEYALIAQFLVFNFLYYTDSRAAHQGRAPSWYSMYRFVLTFIVGGSIVLSLIGRGQIPGDVGNLPAPAARLSAVRESHQTDQAAREAAKEEKKEEEA